MNIKNNQTGSTHVIIAIVLALCLVASLGWIFWQNFMQPKTTPATSNVEKTAPSNSPSTSPKSADNTQYFAISDLGVRFKVPDPLKDTTISLLQSSGVAPSGTKALTTDRIKSDPGCGTFENVTLYRSTTYGSNGTTGYDLLNNKPLGGYYYDSPHPVTDDMLAPCSNPSSVAKDKAALWDMLKTIEVIPAN